MTLKRTPLFPLYREWEGKTIDFGGWELPVQFSGIKAEHEAVRQRAGLFDVSHMGEIIVSGPDSEKFLQKMLTNDVSKIKVGRAQYNIMCTEDGGTIDDLLVYRLEERRYLLVVNAANTEKDFNWLKDHVEGDVTLSNESANYGLLAIQGPLAEQILQKVVDNIELSSIGKFAFLTNVSIAGKTALVSRTGYTGENGFEIYCNSEDLPYLWQTLLENGKDEGLIPCGLGARDTLRLEAALPLYGQELSEDISPIEAGLAFAVKTNKAANFFGKEALRVQKEHGPVRKIAGIEVVERGIPRTGYQIYKDDQLVGTVTSGTQSPGTKRNIGLALMDAKFAVPGTELFVEIRGKRVKAEVVPLPFYKRESN